MEQAKQLLNISPQETAIAPKLTVRENLEFIAEIYGFNKKDTINAATQIMKVFEIDDREKEKADKLSGGLKRRLSIAMAMITQPKIVFLDEPTLGLDIVARKRLWKFIEGLKATTTIILTTHYLEEAEYLSDRIAIMNRGKLVKVGTVEELKTFAKCTTFEDTFLTLAEEVI